MILCVFSLLDWGETVRGKVRWLKRKRPDTTPAISYTFLRTTAKTKIRIPEAPNLTCRQCWGQMATIHELFTRYSPVESRTFLNKNAVFYWRLASDPL